MSRTRLLAAAGIVWFGGMAGFFWSFSVVVMPGLGLSDTATAVAAMQDINAAVRNPLFAAGFFGAALIAAALVVQSLMARRSASPVQTGAVQTGAGVLYLCGVLAVTVLGNVPMNEALAVVDPASGGAASAMADYLRDWTMLNHVRTLSALVAAAMLVWCLARNQPRTQPAES